MTGIELLAEFRATRAEAAFSELAHRYANLVYSIARRRVTDVTLAQEVSQIVFIRFANAPPKLAAEGQLLAWLHRTTVHVSIDLWRSETRRRAREQRAVAMQNGSTEETAWSELTPVLDEALDGLTEDDRQVLLLRFFEQKTMADLGRLLEISEDAAKMRVSRALGRLRTKMGGLGATCSAAVLGTLLFERSVEAAPKGLAATLAAIKVAAPAGVAGTLAGLIPGASGAKLAATLAAVVVLGGAALFLAQSAKRNVSPTGEPAATTGLAEENNPSNTTLAAANSETASTGEPADPDPVKLLRAVRSARMRILSGIVEFDVFTFGTVTRKEDTNHLQLKIQFEDGRSWAEITTQEYSYVTPVPGSPEAEATIKRADALSREQAVREGLLQAFPSHRVVFYDGHAVTDYWETDSPYARTTINEPGHSGFFIFDPRCLGISTFVYVERRVEDCLAYRDTNAVTLAGKESVEGNPAWHIRVPPSDFWLDALHPTRVLKVQYNGNVSISRYSETDLNDALPVEVRNIDYGNSRNGLARYETRLVRRNTQYNVAIDPACWTLDGLHMKVGTEVADSRIHRRIGYWTGSGLSDNLPRNGKREPAAPNRAELLAMLDYDPASSAGFGAALWIITNSPDGADVQKAADVILQSHIRSPDLRSFISELERMRPNCSSNLLQAMLDQNPHREVRGEACLALATLRKDAADYGKNKAAMDEAEKLYQRLIAEFGQVKGLRGYTLAELARPQLAELRQLTIGKMAPDLEGYDLDGRPMKLSNYRGQVVALLFWSAHCTGESDVIGFNRLVDQMEGKPFVLFGIHADNDTEKAKAVAKKYEMKWPSLQDNREGPLYKRYNIGTTGWPTIYVLDRKGVIRSRGLHHPGEIAAAAEKLFQQ
jgi:RNA polymerase sigma factor (sigma-70 family)